MMTLGFVSACNPTDRNEFSGTIYYMHQALAAIPNVRVEVLGKAFLMPGSLGNAFWKACHHKRLARIPFFQRYSKSLLTQSIEADLARLDQDLDAIIAPVASDIISSLNVNNCKTPIIFVTDATPSYIHEHYDEVLVLEEAVQRENQTLQKSKKAVYSSRFMANLALSEYDSLANHPEKIEVLPFGLNLDQVPPPLTTKAIEGPIKLLFVGRWWERKGGQIAVDTVNALRAQGVAAQLTILGCEPPGVRAEHIEIIPNLDKNVPSQQQRYLELLNRSHFLLLPTRADCTPMVIAEANAVGMPVLATNVGGISSLIEDAQNGILFDLHHTGDQYAAKIIDLMNNSEQYKAMSVASRRVYEDRLNWMAWAMGIKSIVANMRA